MVAGSSPASSMPVSPQRLHSAMAASTALRVCSRVAGGTARRMSCCALSTNTPEGAPEGKRSTLPPCGSGVLASTCASSIALWLARSACPSTRVSTTGFCGNARESSWWVGNSFVGQRFWSHPLPWIHSPGFTPFAKATARAITSSYDRAKVTLTRPRKLPSPSRWACASMKPGSTVRPCRSITRAALPPATRASASEPAKAIRPSLTARADTRGRATSTV